VAVSLVAHLTMMALAFTVVWTTAVPHGPRDVEVVVSLENPSGDEPALAPPAPPDDGRALDLDIAPERAQGAALPAGTQSAALADGVSAIALPEVADGLAGGPGAAGTAIPGLEGASAPRLEGREIYSSRVPEVRFAGLGVSNATDIVYVVDASGSTLSTFPVVRETLRRSIGRLARTQRFQVMFFGPRGFTAAPHPSDGQAGDRTVRLIRATPENISAVLEWAGRVVPSGRSNPLPALETALSLKPDAVFLLGTTITGLGQWEMSLDGLLGRLDELNPASGAGGRRRCVIKTVQFVEEDPDEVLKRIAQVHGGTNGYKFISRQEIQTP
jgi:hypothetical protein